MYSSALKNLDIAGTNTPEYLLQGVLDPPPFQIENGTGRSRISTSGQIAQPATHQSHCQDGRGKSHPAAHVRGIGSIVALLG